MVLTVFKFATKGQDENYTGGVECRPIARLYLPIVPLVSGMSFGGVDLGCPMQLGILPILNLVTNLLLANRIDASLQGQDRLVVSWDNKLPKTTR